MPSTSWNDMEDQALQGLRPATQVMYLRGLRRYMDYRTGVVGLTRRISYAALAETAEFLPDTRSTAQRERPTRSAVIAALDELVRHGLVERVGTMVFRLPLATCDGEVTPPERVPPASAGPMRPKYEHHMSVTVERTDEHHDEPTSETERNQTVAQHERHDEHHDEGYMMHRNEHHTSGIRRKTSKEERDARATDPVLIGAARLSTLLRREGVPCNPSDPRLHALVEQGVDPATVQAACQQARRAKGPEERIGLGYIVAILTSWSREAKAMDVRGAKPAQGGRGGRQAQRTEFWRQMHGQQTGEGGDERIVDGVAERID